MLFDVINVEALGSFGFLPELVSMLFFLVTMLLPLVLDILVETSFLLNLGHSPTVLVELGLTTLLAPFELFEMALDLLSALVGLFELSSLLEVSHFKHVTHSFLFEQSCLLLHVVLELLVCKSDLFEFLLVLLGQFGAEEGFVGGN